MPEWFYNTLQATAGIIDPALIKPYKWMGTELGRKGTWRGEILVAPCGHEYVNLLGYWGDNQLSRTYRLSVENDDLIVELEETNFNGVDQESLSSRDVGQIEGFDVVFEYNEYLAGMRRTFAEHYARGAIEDWRQAELEHRAVEAEVRKINDEIVQLPRIVQELQSHLYGEYGELEASRMQEMLDAYDAGLDKARELCKKGDHARCDADKMRSALLSALRMLKKVAPRRVLPVKLQDLGDGPDIGYSMGM